MQYMQGIINPNVLYELSNRFGWVPKHDMGLNQLTSRQKAFAVQLNRRYVATLKGIMPIQHFLENWKFKGGSKWLKSLPNVATPYISELESKVFKVEREIRGLKYHGTVNIKYEPYENVFIMQFYSGTAFANGLGIYDLEPKYTPVELYKAFAQLTMYEPK